MTPPKRTADERERAILSEYKKYWDNLPPEQIEAIKAAQMLNDRHIEAMGSIAAVLGVPLTVENQIAISQSYPGELYAAKLICHFKDELEAIPNIPHRINRQNRICESMLAASQLCDRHSQASPGLVTESEQADWKRVKDSLHLVYLQVKRWEWEPDLTAKQLFLVRVFATLDNVENDPEAKEINRNGKCNGLKTRSKRTKPTEKQSESRKTDYEAAIQHIEQTGFPSEAIEKAKQEYAELIDFIKNKYSL